MNDPANQHITPARRTAILIACGLAQFIVAADYWSVAVALPPMAEDLGVRAVDLQWVVSGYILSFSVMLGIAGPLGDRLGRKRMLLIGIAAFGIVSVFTGMADSPGMVIAARIALGFGGGLLLPLGAAVLANITPSAGIPRAMAMLTAINATGVAIGPALGGLLTDTLNWRWIFYLNIPFSILAFVMVATMVRESRDPDSSGRIDVIGILLIMTSLGLISIGIDRIPHWPTGEWAAAIAVGLVCLGVFVLRELRIPKPIIDLRLLANRTFAGYTLAGMFSNSCWCLLVIITTMLLQKVDRYDALDAGLFFLYLSVSVVVSSTLATYLTGRFGPRPLTIVALFFQLAAMVLFFVDDRLTPLAIGLLIAGVGCSWGWAMPQAGAIGTLAREKVGLASGSILTVMVMVANLMFVVSATMMDAMSGPSGDDYEPGIHASYLLGICLAAAGLAAAWMVIPRSPASTAEAT